MYGTEEVFEVMVELSCRVLIRSKKFNRTLLLCVCAKVCVADDVSSYIDFFSSPRKE